MSQGFYMTGKIPLEVTENVLEDLTNDRNVNDIVREVCEVTGLDSKRAAAYVTRLFVENKDRITLSQKVLEDLTSARNMDDVVREVCERTGLDWKQAEALINRLSAENSDRITVSQSPVLVLLALFTFISGVVLIVVAVSQLYQVYSASTETFLFEMLFLGMNGQVLFWSFLLGVTMILGSLKGMQNVWAAIFEKWGRGE
jgi:non-canonical (house-cleaning) NTP pyrophosphatase